MKYISVLDGSEYKGKFPDQIELAETMGDEPIHHSQIVLYKRGESGYNKGLERWMWHRCYLPDRPSDKGGDGSGHHDHTGLPGVWGGSTSTGRAPDKKPVADEESAKKPPAADRKPSRTEDENKFIEAAQDGNKNEGEDYMGAGVCDTYLVEYEDDGRGVWKSLGEFMNDGHIEVLTYELDQALGLGIVPPTVYSEKDGEEGTSQFFLEDALSGVRLYGVETEKYIEGNFLRGNHPEGENLLLLDHLVANMDRHMGNWMVGAPTDTAPQGKLWAIDNGISNLGNEDFEALAGKYLTGIFLPPDSIEHRMYAFSPRLMKKINKIVGESYGTRSVGYHAFVNKFSPEVRAASGEDIQYLWHSLVELKLNEGVVAW